MSLSKELVKPKYSSDDVEAGKECCGPIVESIDAASISLQAWEHVRLSLANSRVKSFKAGTDPETSFDITANSVAPFTGKGTWHLDCFSFHPRRLILLAELGIMKALLTSVLDSNAEANNATLATGVAASPWPRFIWCLPTSALNFGL